MVKSKSTVASSAAVIFLAACASDVVVHQVLGASYDLQVHTCPSAKVGLVFSNTVVGVGATFCTDGQECTTTLLAAPLAAGASISDTFEVDSDYTFTLSLGSGVSSMELVITDDGGWCVDQLSLGPTGGTLEQLQATAVFVDNPCETDEDLFYEGVPCMESLQYAIGPVVSTTEDLYSFTTTTCDQFFASSNAIPILSVCELGDCHELLLYELYGEETPGREVNGMLDVSETVEWQFWLEAPPSELRLSSFGQLGDADDAWCFAEATFELPVGGTVLALSTADTWLDAPCEADTEYEGGCELEYVFDLTASSVNATEAASTPALTPSPIIAATEVAITSAPTTAAATDAEEPSPAPSTSSPEVTDSVGATSPPTAEEEQATTPAPATTTTDTEEEPLAPGTPSPEAAADSADAVPAPTADDATEDVSDQDTSSATGRCAQATAAWMISVFIAVIVTLAV